MEAPVQPAAAKTPTNADNLRWFALVYVAISIGVAVLIYALAQFHIDLPVGGLATGAFLAAVSASGIRQAQKTNNAWTREDRASLAGGYVLVALGVGLMAAGLLVAVLAIGLGSYFPHLALAWVKQYGLLMLAAFVFISAVFYIGARFILGGIAKRESRRLTT